MTNEIKRLAFVIGVAFLAHAAVAEEHPAGDQQKYLGTETLEACMGRWDKGTNMTKAEWRESCKRVSKERGAYLREHGVIQSDKTD